MWPLWTTYLKHGAGTDAGDEALRQISLELTTVVGGQRPVLAADASRESDGVSLYHAWLRFTYMFDARIKDYTVRMIPIGKPRIPA